MSGTGNPIDVDALVLAINSPGNDVSVRLACAQELRDSMDGWRDQDTSRFITTGLLPIINLLQSGQPIFVKDTPESQLRHVLLQIVNRTSNAECCKDLGSKFVELMLHIVSHDNEDNGCLAVKTLIEVCRNLRPPDERQILAFINAVEKMYGNMESLMEEELGFAHRPENPAVLRHSMKSFKVLMECPIAVVLLIQANRSLANETVRTMLPILMAFLRLQPEPQRICEEQARNNGEIWAGVAPTLHGNQAYRDFIWAQIKTLSYLTFVVRGANESMTEFQDTVPAACVRLLKDCPPEAAGTRKELMACIKHILSTDIRQAFVPQLDLLLDERVILGSNIASQETLRPLAYSILADMIHHVRAELAPAQLSKVIKTYSAMVHHAATSGGVQTMCAKLLSTLTDIVVSKHTREGATEALNALLECNVGKLMSVSCIHEELRKHKDQDPDASVYIALEKSKPLHGATFVFESPDDVSKESRQLSRTLIFGTRSILSHLRQIEAPPPDATILGRFFEGAIRCLSLFRDRGDEKETMDLFATSWFEVSAHIFQETWTAKLETFLDHAVHQPSLLSIAQILFDNEFRSRQLVPIALQHFSDRMELLGPMEAKRSFTVLRFMKMTFAAVAQFTEANESTLTKHVERIIMGSFPLATKYTDTNDYLLLLKTLFRAIGGGQGRFELLYKEVLPLLPEMLESLSKMLAAAEAPSPRRDLLIELSLSVPVRLAHLLKFLHYLMKPLVYALQGPPELVTQGLRTLELMVDNLTAEFLDPALQPVLRELMDSLARHLKPVPAAPHQHSHTIIRILGKLGGRNRRLLERHPSLEFHPNAEVPTFGLHMGGRLVPINLCPYIELGTKTLNHSDIACRAWAFDILKSCAQVLLSTGIRHSYGEEAFVSAYKGLLDSLHIPELQAKALDVIRNILQQAFVMETQFPDVGTRRPYNSPLILFILHLPHALITKEVNDIPRIREFLSILIQDILGFAREDREGGLRLRDPNHLLHRLAARFTGLCYQPDWKSKAAGFAGLELMTNGTEIGLRLTLEREVEVVRALLFVLKDMPQNAPRNSDEVLATLVRVLKACNNSAMMGPSPNQTSGQPAANAPATPVTPGPSGASSLPGPPGKLVLLSTVLLQELPSQHSSVRHAAQVCLRTLAESYEKSVYDLLIGYKDRLLQSIYAKPLRALPLSSQIGYIDAVTYCLSINPPLVEVNDDFTRLLQEVLGMAIGDNELEDEVIGPGGVRTTYRHNVVTHNELRIAYIKFFTAAMPITDIFSKQPTTRQRVTGIYFKSLYSAVPAVKQVANDGLRIVLSIQNRLPKDLLQTGLRPILMNLADPKKLSVPGLEGLAKLLELLTNYFKVEIGTKLLDHFRILADPGILRESVFTPLVENEELKKLVKLVNIFHLLPSSASMFLDDLVRSVVRVEAQLQLSGPNPFTEPLARYLNLHPFEAVDCLQAHLVERPYALSFANILRSGEAPALAQSLMGRSKTLFESCLRNVQPLLLHSTLELIFVLGDLSPHWLYSDHWLLDALLRAWEIQVAHQTLDVHRSASLVLILKIIAQAMSKGLRIDLLFNIFAKFPTHVGADLSFFTRFLYKHLALMSSFRKRAVLLRFTKWFEDGIVDLNWKARVVRNIITPLFQLALSSDGGISTVMDNHMYEWFHRTVWHPMSETPTNPVVGDSLNIELLNLCSILVCHCATHLQDARKDIIKCAWNFIGSEDAAVKQCAYLLAARFFEVFDSPAKFIMRALTGLLRPGQAEIRLLSRQALDILIPVLPKRMPQESGFPQWAKIVRRIMADDTQNQTQLFVVYQTVVRHRDLFYPFRGLFTPQLIQALGKLIIAPANNVETRILLLDVVETIWTWEKMGRAEQSKPTEDQPDAMDVDSETSSGPLLPSQQELLVSYLARLVVAQVDQSQRAYLVTRSLNILTEMLVPQYWSEVQVKVVFFSRAFDQPDREGSSSYLHHCMRMMAIIAKHKKDGWYMTNAEMIQEILQKTINRDDNALLELMQPTLERFMQIFPMPNQEEDTQFDSIQFHGYASTVIADGLRSGSNLNGVLTLLKVVVRADPTRIEPYSPPLMRTLAKFTKEHIASSGTNSPSYDNGVRILLSILEISRIVVTCLGDQRKILLTSLIQLIEKSANLQVCTTILDILRDWILERKDIYPTLKEKAGLVHKMQSYERFNGALYNNYLELVLSIYMDPSLRRTDLTVRLEQSFLVGCRCRDQEIRQKFIDLLDASIPKGVMARLVYILGVQSWEPLADCHWLYLALDLLFTSVDNDSRLKAIILSDQPLGEIGLTPLSRDLLGPTRKLLFLHPEVAHAVWVDLFPSIWSCLTRREQADISHHLLVLFSKEYHVKQAGLRPNVIQTLLCGIRACSPPIGLPPHLLKYLGRTFGAWHVAMELLQLSIDQAKDDEQSFEATHDALVELYADLAEEDMFYGAWRRRSLYPEANGALSLEQNGMWAQAQSLYEAAQNRARSGSHPFSEVEFELWEDHWILAAQKLQQWDVLMDLAKSEGNHDLFLECAWRLLDWNTDSNIIEEHLTAITDVQTPRRKAFEALATLTKSSGNVLGAEFSKVIDDAMQLALRKWASLPLVISLAHVPILQHFQQVLELQEAAQIFASLSSTTASSVEKKSGEMKHILQAWRERLPNLGDDISIWSDLVSWRQHVFTAINRFFSPFITPASQGSATASSSNTIGYRGYHETAWITNRFAHVARKHHLMDVCHTSLNKIYTLPNIEISEAFLKLREQARCYYQSPADLHLGMDVINNTNLMYFSNPQKAEFYTLKAMFFTKLGNREEANRAFASAVQMDMALAKAWAEWGRFGDKNFQESPGDVTAAASAVSCYMQASGLYKSAKSRPLLIRILWLLSVDDGSLAVSRAFDTYKGEAALWYWITLVPQLLISLSHREAKHARYILLNLAKLFPQALFFHLRTSKEEMVALKRSATARQQQQNGGGQGINRTSDQSMPTPTSDGANMNLHAATPPSLRQPYEYIEEIVNILKTAFPLLALTMETFVDQIHTRFKATPDEDAYRFTSILLTEAITAYTQRVNLHLEDGSIPVQCALNASRFATNAAGHVHAEFEQDVIKPKLTLREHIAKLQKWRDRYERILDSRPRFQPLDLLSHWLVEFHHGKWDDIEVPGQYLEHRDNNSNFVKISRVDPRFEVCRAHGFSFRRLTLHGHDGTTHSFAVQVPSARHSRREERLMQLFRIFNVNLARRKETRKRNITFHLPVIVPFNPTLRLLENDASYITMQDVYDQRCEAMGMAREEATLVFADKTKLLAKSAKADEVSSFKLETMTELMSKVTPSNTLTNYMIKTMSTPSDLWSMRKQFGLQISSATFMTYIMCLSARYPSRFHLSRKTGLIHVSEMLPSLSSVQPVFANPEAVPFRLTPNMQHFLTPIGIEGLLTVGLMSIGRALTEPEFEMDQQLSLFLRDEVLTWYNIHQQSPQVDPTFRKQVAAMVDGVVKRAESVACVPDKEKESKLLNNPVSAVQTISNLISTATNPIALAKMSENYHAWF